MIRRAMHTGFRFFFYSNEGTEPLHVNVEHAMGTAKVSLVKTAIEEAMRMLKESTPKKITGND